MKKVVAFLLRSAAVFAWLVLTEEDLEIKLFKLKDLIGVIILVVIAFFILTLNFIIVPFDLARKPIRNLIYKKFKTNKAPV